MAVTKSATTRPLRELLKDIVLRVQWCQGGEEVDCDFALDNWALAQQKWAALKWWQKIGLHSLYRKARNRINQLRVG